MANEPMMRFDFGSVPEEDRTEAIRLDAEVHLHARRVGEEILDLARSLARMQALLKGRFIAWCETECPFTYQHTLKYINVLKEFDGDNLRLSDVGITVLARIAAPSTPEPVRAEAKAMIEAGEKITVADVEEMKRRHAEDVKRLEQEASDAKAETAKAKAAAKKKADKAEEKSRKAASQQSESKSVANSFLAENERLRGEVQTLQAELQSERTKHAPMDSDVEEMQMTRLVAAWDGASDRVRMDFQRRVSVVIPFRQVANH